MKYKWYHECPKPSMELGYEERQVERGTWPFKRMVTERYRIWETKRVRWTCPECGSRWEWSNSYKYTYGWWVSTFRPEIWKDYP